MAITNDGTPLKNVLFGNDYRLLRTFLSEHSHETLKAVVLDGPGEAFRVLATARQGAPLSDVLFADDYHVLRELLSLRGYEALKAAVLDGPDEIFRMLAIARQGEPLADLLFADNARVLCDLCRVRDDKDLRSLFDAEKERLIAFLDIDDLITVLEGKLPTIDFPETALQSAPFLDTLRNSVRWKACIALSETWNTLKTLLPERDAQTEERFLDALQRIQEPSHVRGRILDVITEENVVHLAHGSLRFPCRHSLWTLLHEILLYEDYFFSCDTDTPRIIDGGTHMGMAIYYFKTLYPKARIIGFEPLPSLREIANENIARNGYSDVEILPYALAERGGDAQFHVSDSWTMAGSLHARRGPMGDDVHQITVECVPLSDYLDEPTHFLKLDIEGPEAEVLAEAAHKLNKVQHLFCEFHQGAGLGSDRLAKILSILEAADFEVQVGKSHNYQQTSLKQPFTHFDGAASMLIWARNRNWTG
ncbi:MAG: FkbM family methyltransferase [Candidatus Hydrogenedentes bacterium]|nr:FkbM family methyltransferase [Candidatus Hydrogenedentota bacterium]